MTYSSQILDYTHLPAHGSGTCTVCGGATSDRRRRRCWSCYLASDDRKRVLAWAHAATTARQADVDEMAVERMVSGSPPAQTTRAERQQAVAILTRRGLSARAIAETIGASARTVQRLQARSRA